MPMESLDGEQAEFLMIIAKFVRFQGKHRCPASILKDLPNWRATLRELAAMQLVSIDGESVTLTHFGWSLVCGTDPEILKRGRKYK